MLNPQLAHDDCRRKFGNWICWEFILLSWAVYAPVGCRGPVYNSAAYMRLAQTETGSRLATAAFTAPTRHNSTSLSANCSDSSRLSPTSCEFNTHRRCNWQCVLGFSHTLSIFRIFTYAQCCIRSSKTSVILSTMHVVVWQLKPDAVNPIFSYSLLARKFCDQQISDNNRSQIFNMQYM